MLVLPWLLSPTIFCVTVSRLAASDAGYSNQECCRLHANQAWAACIVAGRVNIMHITVGSCGGHPRLPQSAAFGVQVTVKHPKLHEHKTCSTVPHQTPTPIGIKRCCFPGKGVL